MRSKDDPSAPTHVGRFALRDGVAFEAEEAVLAPAPSGWDSGPIGGPSLLERNGKVEMYYTGGEPGSTVRRIGVATSEDGGKTFARRAGGPVVGPETFPYPVSAVADPEVRVVGDRLEMWCTVALSGGSPSAQLVSAIAHLRSNDGATWVADPSPLLVPRDDAEKGGVVAPAVLVGERSTTLYVTAINLAHEPVVERIVCPKAQPGSK